MMAPMNQEALAAERRRRVQETFQLDPTVIITLKSKDYTLELTNFQAKVLYKDQGINLLAATIPAEKFQDLDFLGYMFWLCLQENQPDMTQEQADHLLSFRHRMGIMGAVIQCLTMFHPDLTDVTPVKPQEAAEGEVVKVVDPSEQPTPLG